MQRCGLLSQELSRSRATTQSLAASGGGVPVMDLEHFRPFEAILEGSPPSGDHVERRDATRRWTCAVMRMIPPIGFASAGA